MEPGADGDCAGQAVRKRFVCPVRKRAHRNLTVFALGETGSTRVNGQGGVSVIRCVESFVSTVYGKLKFPLTFTSSSSAIFSPAYLA